MPEERNKSVRINEQLNKAINTLAGYLDLRADQVVGQGISLLWQQTFPNTAMPTQVRKQRNKT